jgi:hypothetical protein|tara:strand:+ start:1497 stop:1871 length:375 start_codon:yes stop_codon:yes gene_type:complete
MNDSNIEKNTKYLLSIFKNTSNILLVLDKKTIINKTIKIIIKTLLKKVENMAIIEENASKRSIPLITCHASSPPVCIGKEAAYKCKIIAGTEKTMIKIESFSEKIFFMNELFFPNIRLKLKTTS